MGRGSPVIEAGGARSVPATFIELPHARHGQLPDAERLMGQALLWLDDHARR